MQTITILLVCLAQASFGRRVLTDTSSQTEEPLVSSHDALATLLLALNPATTRVRSNAPGSVSSRASVPLMNRGNADPFTAFLNGKLIGQANEDMPNWEDGNYILSEVGWAKKMDKDFQASYNMNKRPSLDDPDDYSMIWFKPREERYKDPLRVAKSYLTGALKFAADPLDGPFRSITNDLSGKRSWGLKDPSDPSKGVMTERSSRIITPKEDVSTDPKRVVRGSGLRFGGTYTKKIPGLPFPKFFNSPPIEPDKNPTLKEALVGFATGKGTNFNKPN